MQRETVKISALRAAPYNPRRISKEAAEGLTKSLERWGVVQEVVANRRTGHIVGGHQRVAALRKMGVKEVPVVWVDLDDVEEKALNVALNNPHISGEFDDTIAGLLAEIRDGIGPDDFEALKLDDLLPPEATVVEGNTDPDDVPEVPEEPITKPGDLWVLGDHRLLCGDSTNPQHVERLMDGSLADIWLTDPPYNVAYEGKTKDALTIQNDAMNDGDFRQFLRDVYSTADSVLRPGAAFYIWHADFEVLNFVAPIYELDWKLTQILNWVKPSIVMGRKDYHYKHEPCLYGWKQGAAHTWNSDRKQTTVLEFDKPSRNGEHPTMKPVGLFQYQLDNSSKPGQIVLDSFGGSGTTLIAAERIRRKARIMELDPAYCDVIVKRWEDFTGKKAVLEANDATG